MKKAFYRIIFILLFAIVCITDIPAICIEAFIRLFLFIPIGIYWVCTGEILFDPTGPYNGNNIAYLGITDSIVDNFYNKYVKQ